MSKTYVHIWITAALCAVVLLSSCNVTKHLDDSKQERLLVKNTLTLKSEKKLRLSEKTSMGYTLAPYYRQKPNRKSFGFFYTRLWCHYKYKDRHSGFAEFMRKRIAEPPTIYSDSLSQRTALNFRNEMRQSGYFRAECTYGTTLVGKKKIKANYGVNLGPLYTAESVQFTSRDTALLQVLNRSAGESLIKPGTPLDARIFEAERFRIATYLKNNGYAYVIPQFVEYSGDSSGTKAAITVEILPYNDSTMHKVYQIGKVEVLSSVVPTLSSMRRDTLLKGVYFAGAEPKLLIKPSLLRKKILLNPGAIYRQSDFDKTNRNLNALGVYRFVSMRLAQDSIEPERINVTVNLSPDKRFYPGFDLDLNYSRSSFSSGLLGLSPNVSIQNRNLLGGAEHLRSVASYNVEFDVAQTDIIFSTEYKFQNELLIPQYFDYLGMWRNLHRIHIGRFHLVPTNLYNRIRNDGEARVSANFNYQNVRSFYNYKLLNFAVGINVRSHPEHQYTWDYLGIDVLQPDFILLSPDEFLKRSFADQLFTGFLMRSYNYSYASRTNRFGERWNYRFNAEMSGLEILALNKAWNGIFSRPDSVWRIGTLEFSQYLRFDQEAVYTRNFSKDVAGAVRIGAGVATPFGNSKAVPFVKQYFVGGPGSLRAWRIRELGPGAFVELNDNGMPRDTAPFYQTADFRFEFNGELRFPLFLWFKGAFFVDGGNVWTLKNDDSRPGSKLNWDSWRNIAIGTGLGLRIDVDYFVLRLDFGLPLRRPYTDANGHYWVRGLVKDFKWSNFNPNLAVGYPF